jgi:uncharacterized delta-60 repeat protein
MAKTLQFRRGTSSELSSVTGAVGELFVDTTKDTVVVMDGSTAGGKPLATEQYVGTAISNLVDSAPGALDTLNELAAALGDDANFATSISNTVATAGSYANSAFSKANTATTNAATADQRAVTSGSYANSAFSKANTATTNAATADQRAVTSGSYANSAFTKANTALTHAQAAYNAANTAGGGSADLSEVSEDILPLFTEVYDLGSSNKRWYDVYANNKLDIAGAEIFGSEEGIVVPSGALIDQILISDNMITPDDTSIRQYFGSKGVVNINGNINIDGDWLGTPVTETLSQLLENENGGTLDSDFSRNVIVDGTMYVVKIQSDGKILVGGAYLEFNNIREKYLVRLNADGTRDTSFLLGEGFNGWVYAIAIQSDGKILVGGDFQNYKGSTQTRLIRLNSNGTKDATFNIGTGFNNDVRAITIQPDGKILVGGIFTSYNGSTQNRLVRLNSDGTKDTTFDIGTGFNDDVAAIAIQSDGKILVGGEFSTYSGSTQRALVRLNSDGTKNTFVGTTSFPSGADVYSIAIQSDGKILAGGNFNSFSGFTAIDLVRIDSDGSKDNTFDTGDDDNQITGGLINSIAIQSDGKILVGGSFDNHGGGTSNQRGLIRLNSDATKDTTFDIGTGFTGYNETVHSIEIQSDGNILVGGSFETYNGTAALSVVRLYGEGVDARASATPPTLGEEGFIRYNKDIKSYQAFNGTTWQLLDRVAPPKLLGKSGTVNIDFSQPKLHIQDTLFDDVTYTGSSYFPGSTITIKIINKSSSTNLDFPAGWIFVGSEKPSSISANNIALLSITSFGTTEEECVAFWRVQS